MIIVTESLEYAIRALNIVDLFGYEVETKAVENFICSKYILQNVDVTLTVKDIFENLWKEIFSCMSVTRFTKQDSMEPIPVILGSELREFKRSSVKIHLCKYRVEPFIKHPTICKKMLVLWTCVSHL